MPRDDWDVQKTWDLRELPGELVHAAQIAVVDRGLTEGWELAEIRETLDALGIGHESKVIRAV